MQGGLGVDSYTQNSEKQAFAFSGVAPALKDVIASKGFGHDKDAQVVCIADLGCATGSNTINAVRFVARQAIGRVPVQAYFSDLSSNDFNTLLQQLEESSPPLGCFVAAVSGSFYERLFPSSSLHIVMCNISLHWLSKMPDSRTITSGNHFTVRNEAFATQAHEDLCRFLTCRAQEIVPGGILSLVLLADKSSQPQSEAYEDWYPPRFEMAWKDMLMEGLIDGDTYDSLRMSWFHRRTDEVVKANIDTGEAFTILMIEYSKSLMTTKEQASLEEYVRNEVGFCKNITGASVSQHLKGNDHLVDEFYKRLGEKFNPEDPSNVPDHVNVPLVLAILKRK